MSGVIYSLVHVVSGREYIGKTEQGIEERKRRHCVEAKNGSTSKIHRAIRKYGIDAFDMHVLDQAMDSDSLNLMEQYYIRLRGSLSPDGFNLTEGGTGGRMCQTVLDRISQKMTGRPRNPDAVRRTAIANTGKKRTEETKRKIGNANRGKPGPIGFKRPPFTEEHRAKISATLKGRPNLALKGKPGKSIPLGSKRPPFSEEWKRKISVSKKGSVAWNRGIPFSSITRERMSIAQKARWAKTNGVSGPVQ